jgi:hypothetical protein
MIPVEDAVRVALETMAWHDGLQAQVTVETTCLFLLAQGVTARTNLLVAEPASGRVIVMGPL